MKKIMLKILTKSGKKQHNNATKHKIQKQKQDIENNEKHLKDNRTVNTIKSIIFTTKCKIDKLRFRDPLANNVVNPNLYFYRPPPLIPPNSVSFSFINQKQ